VSQNGLKINVYNADLIQLAGMKSIEAAGGPHVPFTPGTISILHPHYASLLGNMCLQDGWLHNEATWFLADIRVDGLHCDIAFESRGIGGSDSYGTGWTDTGCAVSSIDCA